jgi:hypothetical protein
LSARPSVFDFYVLTINITVFRKPLVERRQLRRRIFGRPSMEKSDHWHRRLFRACSERPSGGRSAERGYEFPPSYAYCHLPRPRRHHARYTGTHYHA